ncbi:energy coupling factor transporter S component ThiW [Butyrivibrio fibrisolvens]|uniref:energy coupling factor transporter S component ThiW n=1 Tax=Butyrivibrio fibrisolvens TaxID=831 RepID=UPI0003B71282|nr:energy coupling factor transporter S component ThiW [Butyrivibrio fibrisolvens]
MKKAEVKKLVVAAMFVALAVSLSTFSFPIGASKCFPIQHMVNVLSAVFLGPWYGVLVAFCTSLIRNLLGTGTLLAFPGSMVGALCCGLVYKISRKLIPTYIAEVIGTGILGGIIAFPVASLVMGKEAALFTYVVPFLVSTVGGTVIAALLITVLYKTHAINTLTALFDDADSIRSKA